MNITIISNIFKNIEWRRAFASAYLRSSGGYIGLKMVIFTFSGLAGQYMFTHFLTKADYGLIIWAGTIVSLLGPFGLPGISSSITGAVAKGFDGNYRRGTWYEMIGGTIGGAVLLGFAGYYNYYLHDRTSAMIFMVVGVLGPGLWLDTQQCYWNGKKNFKAIFIWSVSIRLIELVATAGVLCYSANPVLVFGIQNLINVFANIFTAFGIMRSKELNKKFSTEYHSFGMQTTFLSFAGIISVYLDRLVVGSFLGMNILATFAVGELLYNYIYKIPSGILTQIFLPRLAEMDIKAAANWIMRRQRYLISGLVITVLLIAFTLSIWYPLVFSVKYIDSILYAQLFLICIVLGAPTLMVGTLVKAHALKRETLNSWLIMWISPMIFVPLLGWKYGVIGVILSRGITNALLSSYYYSLLRKLQKA